MRGRSVGCGLGLLVAASTLGLLIAELGLRLFLPQPLLHDPDAFLPDPVLGARLKPGFSDKVVTTEFSSMWVVNADGYRGPRAGERGLRARRVVALGDSFTFGYGVEESETWPRRLEAILDEGPNQDGGVEVVNLGVGGYGTWQEALYLERIWEPLRPDLAIVALYVGNDPEDNARAAARSVARSAPGIAAGAPAGSEGLKRWLGSRLHVYSLISTRGDQLLVRAGLRRLVHPFEMEILMRQPPGSVQRAWEATREALARLAGFSAAHELKMMVVLVPMKHQISDAVWDRVVSQYARGADALELDREGPQRILSTMCAEAGLRCLDLMAGLREAASQHPEAPLYWPRDQHWTASGHEAAARIISMVVRSL